MKTARFAIGITLALTLLLSGSALSQTTGARISPNGITVDGVGQGLCGEASYNSGVDGCLYRQGVGQYGWSNGIQPPPQLIALTPNFLLSAPAAAGTLGTATTGGTIAAGTYRIALTYVTAAGGETPIGTDSASTQVTTGTTSTITGNAPSAISGAVGYRIYVSPAGGAANTEVLQPLSTAVCAGAFTAGGGITVCPFGSNYTLTSLVSTGYATPAISGAPNTAGLLQLTAGPQTAITNVTTAQTMFSTTIAAGAMNVQGKRIHIHGTLVFSNGATTPIITLVAKIGTVSSVSIAGAANANTNSNSPVHFDMYVQTTTTGTSGADEGHGCFTNTVAAAWSSGTAMPVYCDGANAASSTYDHTVANTLAINIAANATLTTVTLRDLEIDATQF